LHFIIAFLFFKSILKKNPEIEKLNPGIEKFDPELRKLILKMKN
jgi:hypothetical protein